MNTNTEQLQHARRAASISVLVAAPLLLALTALGCGEQKEKAVADAGMTAAVIPGVGNEAPQAAVASAQLTATAVEGATQQTTDETLPPDIVATGPEGIVLPGSVVTIAATGSTDVTSVMLTDRAGAKTPFTYDSESNLWRAQYRVPLRVGTEKLALGVTASTDANRWKRIWVFLQLREDARPTGTATEDSSGCAVEEVIPAKS